MRQVNMMTGLKFYNAGNETVNLSGLYMTNSLLKPLAYKIPPAQEFRDNITRRGI